MKAFADQYAALGEFRGWTAPGLQFSSMFFVFILDYDPIGYLCKEKHSLDISSGLSAATGDAALLAGINVRNVKFIVFMIADCFCRALRRVFLC